MNKFAKCHARVLEETLSIPNPFYFDEDIWRNNDRHNSTTWNFICSQTVHNFLNDVFSKLLLQRPKQISYAQDILTLWTNMGIALMQKGDIVKAMGYYLSALTLLRCQIAQLEQDKGGSRLQDHADATNDRKGQRQRQMRTATRQLCDRLIQISSYIFQGGKSGCVFSVWTWFDDLQWFIETHQLQNGLEVCGNFRNICARLRCGCCLLRTDLLTPVSSTQLFPTTSWNFIFESSRHCFHLTR